MDEKELRKQFVDAAASFLGVNESDGSHRKIIDIYNSHKSIARGYKVTYSDPWCATFVSAVSIKCNLTDIIPTECGCGQMIELHKKLGTWSEDESIPPEVGDIIMYDWDDDGKGDNVGWPDHVGIVCEIGENWIKIIEGNLSNSVKYRWMSNNGKFIRGYCKPDFASKASDAKPIEIPEQNESQTQIAKPSKNTTETDVKYTINLRTLKKGCKGEDVKALQILLIGRGYSCGSCGTDGDFGTATDKAVRSYQKTKSLSVDGKAGPATMGSLLGV